MKCVCPMGGDRACPDDCPLAVWASLSAKDRKAQRKPIAEGLYKQGFTQEQIATQLGVAQNTVSLDLADLSIVDNSKRAKTATNPKGAGRKKGRKAPKPHNKTPDVVELFDQGLSQKDIAAETGVGKRQVRHITEDEMKIREAIEKAQPEIDRKILSMTAQEKFDTALRQHKKKFDDEFRDRVTNECNRLLNEVSLPHYAKELERLEQSIRNRKGIMDRLTYRKILACLHPDRVADQVLKKRYEEAFRLFTELEKRVLDEKESPTQFRDRPNNAQELYAMKAKLEAERRAKRAAKGTLQ